MKLKNDILISLNEIKRNYNLDSEVLEIIEMLYSNSNKIKNISSKEVINLKGENHLTELDKLFEDKKNFVDTCGIYIFLNDNNEPVYIGVSAEVGSKQDLRTRLSFHFNTNSSNSNLVDNIIEIESLLNGKNLYTEEKEERKKLINEYTPNLLIIVMGELNSTIAIKKSLDLEKILIALFNSKYNK